MKEPSPGTSKLRSTLRHGRLTQLCDAVAASSPHVHWRYVSHSDFFTSCWGLEGWARWVLGSGSPDRSRLEQPSEMAATQGPCTLSWATLLDNPLLNFTARKGFPRPISAMGHFHCHLQILIYNLKREGNTQPIFLSCALQIWSMHVLQQLLLSTMAASSFCIGTVAFLAWRCASVATVLGLSLILTC